MTCLLLLLACTSEPPPPPPPAPAPAVVAPAPPPELPDPTDARLAATHLVVAWDGAALKPRAAGRSRDTARELATQLHDRATPETIEALAREASDEPTGRRGGRLGVWATGVMDRQFERCVGATEVGAIGAVCETPFGFHVLRRDPVVEAEGSVLVARYPTGDEVASQAALARLNAALERVHTEDPGPVAAELELELQRLGTVGGGQLLPSVEAALFALEPGAASPPIATPGAWVAVTRASR